MYKYRYTPTDFLLALAIIVALLIGFYKIDATMFEDLSFIITFAPRLW